MLTRVKLVSARTMVSDSGASDARVLKQAVKILQETSTAADERIRAASTPASYVQLPSDISHEFSRTAAELAAALANVWGRYCVTDLPALLQSLTALWRHVGNDSGLPVRLSTFLTLHSAA